MPVPAAAVGSAVDLDVRCDARWLMAHAASVGSFGPRHFDTVTGIIAHPLFTVGPEWALLTRDADPFGLGLTAHENTRGVHAAHHVQLHRPVRAGDVVHLLAEIVAVRRTPPGALTTIRFSATRADGAPMWTTWMDSLYRGIDVVGDDVFAPHDVPTHGVPALAPTAHRHRIALEVAPGAAHLYSECARIWNPIHTDLAVARAAGLPSIILHGTATLAMAVTSMIDHLGCDAAEVRQIAGSFRAMVPVPAHLDVAFGPPEGGSVAFEVTHGEQVVIRGGVLELGHPRGPDSA